MAVSWTEYNIYKYHEPRFLSPAIMKLPLVCFQTLLTTLSKCPVAQSTSLLTRPAQSTNPFGFVGVCHTTATASEAQSR